MIRTLDDLAVDGAAVGVRVDVNSPLAASGSTGEYDLADDSRLRAHVDTLSELLERGGRVAVLAHQGRPGGAEFAPLSPHADRLDDLLDHPVEYVDATFSAAARECVAELEPGEAVVLENTRFYAEEYMEFAPERAADTYLVAGLAPALDAYVNDAFAAAHRSQPSLVGFPVRVPAYAGRMMERELDVLGGIDDTPTPRVYVLGGTKVGDSVDVAATVLERGLADAVLATGLVGNVFLLAAGSDLGLASTEFVYEEGHFDEVDRAGDLLDKYGEIHTPVDVAVERDGERHEIAVEDLPPEAGEPVKDVGSATVAAYEAVLDGAETVVLNGPAGVVEESVFAAGTEGIYRAAAGVSHGIVGGGDTAAAIRRLGIEGFEHVSTGGGAALSMLTGASLPAVEALRERAD
jgi:phosphoglycerate kinase